MFRPIAALLVEDGYAPAWFAEIDYIARGGETRNLALIPECLQEEALLVDDFDIYVHPGQESQWIPAPLSDGPDLRFCR